MDKKTNQPCSFVTPKIGFSLSRQAPWYSINDVCSYAFALEALIMFLGYGWRHFDSAFNKFDSLIVLLCLVDVLIPLPAVSVMRFFRVANIVSKSTVNLP